MSLIAVVDYGMGNLRSVAKALEHVAEDVEVRVTSKQEDIASAERVVFPGQGAARDCMHQLNELGLIESVRQAANEKPFLGICMGLQVLLDHSQENDGVDCIGLFPGKVQYFGDFVGELGGTSVKIPHMGWNNVEQTIDHPLWQGIEPDSRFYFVHSYFIAPEDEKIIAGRVQYGIRFATAIASKNVFAVQFHPEKSASDGMQLLRNFVSWNGEQ